MKLAELLPLITEQTMIKLSYLSGLDVRVACRYDDTRSVIDYIREEKQDITELTIVSVNPDVYYQPDEDYWDDYGGAELLVTVDGWEEQK